MALRWALIAEINAEIETKLANLKDFNSHFDVIIQLTEAIVFYPNEEPARKDLWLDIHKCYCEEWAERASHLTHLRHLRDNFY